MRLRLSITPYLVLFVVVIPLTGSVFFFFNDTATTEIYTLSLHDALPIWRNRQRQDRGLPAGHHPLPSARQAGAGAGAGNRDRKSTRLNSSHSQISYAVFCLKKKKSA